MQLVGLKAKIYIILGVLVVINLTGGLATFLYMKSSKSSFSISIQQQTNALEYAQEMYQALLWQQLYVEKMEHDYSPQVSRALEIYDKRFLTTLNQSLKVPLPDYDISLLQSISKLYDGIISIREQEQLPDTPNEQTKTQALYEKQKNTLLQIGVMCKQLIKNRKDAVFQTTEQFQNQTEVFKWLVWGPLATGTFIGLVLILLVGRHIFTPIRKIINGLPNYDIDSSGQDITLNEVSILYTKILQLLENVDQTQQHLAQSRKDLAEADKMVTIGKLAAGMAHSVRNPLTSVKMRLFTLKRNIEMSSDVKEDFEVIDEEIIFIDTIVKNFLEFSRPPKLKQIPISLSDIIDQCIKLLKHKLEFTGTKIILDRQEKLPLVLGDPSQIMEVLVNILVNAMDAMREMGVITIIEEYGVIEPFGKVIILRIKDSGPGIPAKTIRQIFDPFFTTKEEGTGLGLSIARQIVEEHGGWIHANSEPGHGTTFVIGLPIMEQHP